MYDKAIFHGGKVVFDEKGGQRKIAMDVENLHLPLMTWSAGQKRIYAVTNGILLPFWTTSECRKS